MINTNLSPQTEPCHRGLAQRPVCFLNHTAAGMFHGDGPVTPPPSVCFLQYVTEFDPDSGSVNAQSKCDHSVLLSLCF